MTRFIGAGKPMCFFAFSVLAVFVGLPARADIDKTAAAVSQARVQYEQKMQAIRDEVFDKIKEKDTALRSKPKPKSEELEDLRSATSDFVHAGKWPRLPKIKECQARARNATKELARAMEIADQEYLRAKRDDAAMAVRAEREQFLKENDIAPWRDILVDGLECEKRTIGQARRAFELGETVSRNYRLEIVAQRSEGSGSLTMAIPVPGKKRLEIKTSSGMDAELRVLLSVRDSLISADLGISRPLPVELRKDDSPGKIEFWADQGKFDVESIRLKPILLEGGEMADAKPGDSNPVPDLCDPASPLTKDSKWRGKQWHGQNPNALHGPRTVEATVSLCTAGQVEFRTEWWIGGWGPLNWVFDINGDQLTLRDIYIQGGNATFENVQGGGIVVGDTLQFKCSSRYVADGLIKFDYNEFEFKRIP